MRLCAQSLLELHKRRQTITEPECRYFIHQMALACAYLHRTQVIHRDLKLGNLLLNDAMEIKIGDFGLATRLDFDGERKLYDASLCFRLCQLAKLKLRADNVILYLYLYYDLTLGDRLFTVAVSDTCHNLPLHLRNYVIYSRGVPLVTECSPVLLSTAATSGFYSALFLRTPTRSKRHISGQGFSTALGFSSDGWK